MKLSVIVLGCWMSGHISAVHISAQNSSPALQNRPLRRRAPSGQRSPGRSPRSSATISAYVGVEGGNNPYRGSAFAKNEDGKNTVTGENARYVAQVSHTKVSAGATHQEQARVKAVATGKNVGVKFVVPKGSQGNYYAVGSTGTRGTVDHTQSPFKMTFPHDPEVLHSTVVARLTGPGSVKAKAWN